MIVGSAINWGLAHGELLRFMDENHYLLAGWTERGEVRIVDWKPAQPLPLGPVQGGLLFAGHGETRLPAAEVKLALVAAALRSLRRADPRRRLANSVRWWEVAIRQLDSANRDRLLNSQPCIYGRA